MALSTLYVSSESRYQAALAPKYMLGGAAPSSLTAVAFGHPRRPHWTSQTPSSSVLGHIVNVLDGSGFGPMPPEQIDSGQVVTVGDDGEHLLFESGCE
jgi:hypothetical protein